MAQSLSEFLQTFNKPQDLATAPTQQGFGAFARSKGFLPQETAPEPTNAPIADALKSFAGGAVQGTGLAASGLGNAQRILDERTGGLLNPLIPGGVLLSYLNRATDAPAITDELGQWISDKGNALLESRSDATKQALLNSQVSGTLWQPNTWDFGEDPTMRGLGMQMLEVFGNLSPIVAASVIGGPVGGGIAGGAQGGQAAREQSDAYLDEAFNKNLLWEASPKFRALVREGKTPQDALASLKKDAGDLAQILTTPISAGGGALLGDVLQGSVAKAIPGLTGKIGSVVAGAAIEGTEEVGENITSKLGTEIATGAQQDYGKGTFGDFFMGAIAGGIVGGGAPKTPTSAGPTTPEDMDVLLKNTENLVEDGGIEPAATAGAGVAVGGGITAGISAETTAKQIPVGGDTGVAGIKGEIDAAVSPELAAQAKKIDDIQQLLKQHLTPTEPHPQVAAADIYQQTPFVPPVQEEQNAPVIVDSDFVELEDLEGIDLEFEPLNDGIGHPSTWTNKPAQSDADVINAQNAANPATKGLSLAMNNLNKEVANLGLKYIAPKKGSALGGVYQDMDGSKYLIKKYKEQNQAYEEVIASDIVAKASKTGTSPMMNAPENMSILQSPWMEFNVKPFDPSNDDHVAQAKEDLVLNAWLANWDVFGLEFDNVIMVDDQLTYVDLGGALDYRAQGAKKGLSFQENNVPEINSLKDASINPQSAQIYKNVSDQDIYFQVKHLAKMFYKTGAVKTMLQNSGMDGAQKDLLEKKLVNRLNYLVKTYAPDTWAGPIIPSTVSLVPTVNEVKTGVKTPAANSPKKIVKVIKSSAGNSGLLPLEALANDFSSFNNGIIYSYSGNNDIVETILKEPLLFEIIYDENYAEWIKGNKIWWQADQHKLFWHDNKDNLSPPELLDKYHLLPPILFHGVKPAHAQPSYDPETGAWHVIPVWDKSKQGKGAGGGDTDLGVFLTDNPYQAYKWAGNYVDDTSSLKTLSAMAKHSVQPFVLNLNPVLYDYKGGIWNSAKNHTLAAEGKKLGYNGLITFNVNDSGGKQTQVIVFEPSGATMKSPYSKAFDKTSPHFAASYTSGGKEETWVPLSKETYKKLQKELRRFGLDGIVDLRVFTAEKDPHAILAANFEATKKGLFIGLASALPTDVTWDGEFHHEVIHALRYLGFFATQEGKVMWRILQNEIKARGGITKFVQDNYDPKYWLEEEIARLMSEYRNGIYKPKPDSAIDKVLRKIRDLWEAFKNWAQGNGFHTAEEILDYITSGNLSSRYWMLEAQDAMMENADADVKSAFAIGSKFGLGGKGKQHVDYYNRLVKHGWNVIQLAKKNLHIGWLQEYVQRAGQWHNKKTQWMAHANETVGKWNNLPLSQQSALAEAFYEIEHSVEYRDPSIVERNKLDPQEAKILMKYGLKKDAILLYIQVRSDFRKMLNEIERVTMNSIAHSMPTNPIGVMIEQAKAKKDFINLKKTPYFPHARFGSFTIVVKDKSGKTVYAEMFEREKSRDKAYEGVVNKFPATSGYVVAKSKLSDEAQIYRGIPQSFLIAMQQNLGLSQKQKIALEEMIVHSGPAVSFKNHFTKKEHIEGYSKDALRAYADYFWHGANHVARIEYGPLMEEAIAKGEDDIKNMIATGQDSTRRREINDHIRMHYSNIMNPQEDWAALRSVGFMWWLGFHVKSAVMNFMQVPMVTYSHLASQFGDTKSLTSLSKNMKHMNAVFRSPDKAMAQLTPADATLISMGIQDGFLDESFAAELAGIAEGSNLTQGMAKSRARKAILAFNHIGGYLFQAVEKINRRVTFMTAVDLARRNPNAKYLQEVRTRFSLEFNDLVNKKGLSPEEATAFLAGKDTVESTQFNYQSWARPQIMQGRKSAFLTFFMFTQNMLWFIQNNPGNTRYLLLLLLFAGIQGMPFADDAEELVEAFGRRAFGKEWNIEQDLREVLIEVMGEDGPPPDLFLHGISRYGFGLPQLADMTGLPLPSVDLSSNIGMGSPLPIVSPLIQAGSSIAKGGDFDTAMGKFTQEGVGATLGIPIALLKSMADSKMRFDDPKRWESAMPAALASLSKALRFYNEGAERTRTGAELVQFDKGDPTQLGEIVMQSMGFRPTKLAQAWDKVIMQREAAQFWETRRSALLRQWDWAVESGDPADKEEVLKAINRFNQSVPYAPLKLTRGSLNRSRKAREKVRQKFESGLPNSKMMRGVYRDIDRLYPELNSGPTYEEKLPSGN